MVVILLAALQRWMLPEVARSGRCSLRSTPHHRSPPPTGAKPVTNTSLASHPGSPPPRVKSRAEPVPATLMKLKV